MSFILFFENSIVDFEFFALFRTAQTKFISRKKQFVMNFKTQDDNRKSYLK